MAKIQLLSYDTIISNDQEKQVSVLWGYVVHRGGTLENAVELPKAWARCKVEQLNVLNGVAQVDGHPEYCMFASSVDDYSSALTRACLAIPAEVITSEFYEYSLGAIYPFKLGKLADDIEYHIQPEFYSGNISKMLVLEISSGKAFMRFIDTTDPSTYVTAEEAIRIFAGIPTPCVVE